MSDRLHLIAHIAGRGVLLDAAQVHSVVDIDNIVPVPGSAPAVRGLAALRSRVVTVIDTWRLLDLPAPPRLPRRAAVTQVDGNAYAVLLDSLDDVAAFSVRPPTIGVALGDRWAAIATGTANHVGEPMLAIDLHRLVDAVSTAHETTRA